MNNNGWRLARIFGIPVTIHYSWLFIFALVVWSIASDYLPMHHPGIIGGGVATWAWAIAAALLFFASVLVHELAHSLLARARGIPVEGITLFALGGFSALRREATRPRVELAVALVGPLTSLALAGLFWVASRALPPVSMPAAAVAFYLAYGNAALGIFNLIPGFPLDGGRALRAVVWAASGDLARATRVAVRTGRLVALLLVGYGAWQTFVDGAGAAGGLWLILIGWYLWSAATQEGTRATVDRALSGRTVETFLGPTFIALDPGSTVARAAEQIAAAPPQTIYPVLTESATLLGALSPRDLAQLSPDRWSSTSVNWLVRRAAVLPTVPLDADARESLAVLDQLTVDALPVADPSGRVVGTFERAAVLRWLQIRSSLAA